MPHLLHMCVIFILCQVEDYRNILKLSCRPLAFNSNKTILNNNDIDNNNDDNNNNKSAWTRNSRWQLAQDIQPLDSKVKMHPNNKMKARSQSTYHIVRRVGKQGTRPPRELN